MGIRVEFNPKQRTVMINGVRYTQKELEDRIKTKTEKKILEDLKYCIKTEPGDEDIDDTNDDVYRLVQSDRFKGDNHSMALVSKQFIFWEQQERG